MIIRHLPYFAVAAEEENLQRAANRLGVTQPALSRRIQLLEAELGAPLFDRSGGRLKLTAVGEMLGREARRVVQDVDEITRSIRGHYSQGAAALTIGMNERAIANPALARAIGAYRRANPKVDLNTLIMSSAEQAVALREGRLDLAFLYLQGGDEQISSREMVEDDPFVIALPNEHPLAALDSLQLEDLDEIDMIWPSSERVPLVFNALWQLWQSHGLVPRVKTEIYSGEAALWAVAAGLGIAVVRESGTLRKPPGVAVRNIEALRDHHFPLRLAWLAKFETQAMRGFFALLGERHILAS